MVRPLVPVIELANKADIAKIAAFYHATWLETHGSFMTAEEIAARDLEFFQRRVQHIYPNILVAKTPHDIAAFSAWQGELLGQFFVAAHLRGGGLAQMLMKTTECAMWQAGSRNLTLRCVVGNLRARNFYEKMGWQVVKIENTLMAGPDHALPLHFWVMNKYLERQPR